ncbi:N-acetylmuramic acid 6-phosphate etherase [Marinitoga hydrogenitolerans DSM 16785]|uniref:N-acetylmuramic acid 6-phosphate etherase n=1 Tax=Marinitoga hydrogenitolerans (strain DSM 16785 / JCM 12826 / AT1271) TaxID=1122195 RepID=A0A1M4ZSP3_MARH1|nr:N-acetylmuramic acid 6-phosphate etherase [Marinitoga hydrogenitolerans]SHF21093.1 N-acetylmuramic acid 6-phosphate etherase [Marinitoga hydrogenitolerans DSM 16785]
MLEKLETELSNPKTKNIDNLEIIDILRLINQEDAIIPVAIAENLKKIEEVIKFCIESLNNNGRIIYCGAGTSGRIAVIDAVETVPTFGVEEGTFLPLLAGGKKAFFRSIESVEDNIEDGIKDFLSINPKKNDTVIGIAASGRTPYVKGILEKARKIGCKTALICNVKNPEIDFADITISLNTGPEVITGSTRMKAGTSQKIILNMISTTTMIKLGKTYGNYMVDVQILNEKLEKRAIKMISEITSVDFEESKKYLKNADHNVKLAILMILSEKPKEKCKKALEKTSFLYEALKILK